MKNRFLHTIFNQSSLTENGAVSNATTGSILLDYFSKSATYRDRSLDEVFGDMSAMWHENPRDTLRIMFYNRMITRTTTGFVQSDKPQAGQGNKDEFRKCITWVARYYPEVLNANLWLIPVVGCWKDLWHQDLIDELDNVVVFALVARGISCTYNRDLVAKYLPRIRSKSNTHNYRHRRLNLFAYELIRYLGWTPVQYRKFKSSGKAHDFQRKLSHRLFDEIDFGRIPGRALHQMVNVRGKDSKTIIERHGMTERYIDWISSQPVAKFTGYVYELMKTVNHRMTLAQKHTVDRQFDGLIAQAREIGDISENVWCALDTSGSMTASVADTSAYDICISLGIYFSTLNRGAFKDHVMMFDNQSRVKKLSGTFSDKVMQLSQDIAWGSTNFQSVIDEIVRVRKQNPNIPLSDFPTTLIVVSDMQFNPTRGNTETNYHRAMQKLEAVGLSQMRIVWWWVTGRGTDFPSTLDDTGVMMLSGFDGSILSLLLNQEVQGDNTLGQRKQTTPYDAMQRALGQDILNKIII